MLKKISQNYLNELKAFAEKATPGPWEAGDEISGERNVFAHREDGHSIHEWHIAQTVYAGTVDDAAYIAAANPAVVLVLIDRIERLEEENDKLIKENKCLEQNVIDIRDFCREFKCISANLADEMDADDKVFEDMVAEDEAQLDWLASQLEARDIADHYEDRLSITDMKDKTDWRKAAREAVEKENESHKSTD